MTVENLFINVFDTSNLGYIRLVQIVENNQGIERTCETLSASEMANLMLEEVKAYYQIGEYWYVIVGK